MNEKKVNILHLQNYLNISCGVSKTIYVIAKNTSSQFKQYILCFGGDGFSRFESININPLILKYHNNFVNDFIRNLIIIHSFCKNNNINIIHSHHRYFDVLAFFISRMLKIKTITSVHSKVFDKKIFSYKADVLIACSNSIKEHLINVFTIDERRIKVIYNCVDPTEVVLTKTKTELLDSIEIPSDKFIIGYFGRLDFKEKGIDILLEAFLRLSKLYEDLFLLLIGNGIDGNKIKDFNTKNSLSAKMINSQEDIFSYYQLLDLFVLPSRTDSFPLTMLEAGLMKIPFVGSKVDGISELIEQEKDGLLFESENVSDLTKQILRLIDDKKLVKSLSENLYQKIISSYTVNKIVPQYEALYRNC